MTDFDFTPLFRSTVGFDRMMQLVDSALHTGESGGAYPPYNIEKLSDNAYRITMAVAGFSEDDIKVMVHENTLFISGKNRVDEEEKVEYLYRGIAGRAFERRFQLADFIKVGDAKIENGLLKIELIREVPEAKKPREIKITNTKKSLPNK